MLKGTIKFFNKEKGFGFIIESESKNEYFVHATKLVDKNDTFFPSTKVEFELKDGRKGHECVNVRKV